MALRYHDLAKLAELATLPHSSLYLKEGPAGLQEDLIEGFLTMFAYDHPYVRFSISTPQALIRELDNRPPDGHYRGVVVRTGNTPFSMYTSDRLYSVLERLEREQRNARLRILFVGPEPKESVREWFEEREAYGVVSEPTFEMLGRWVAAKTVNRWAYQTLVPDALVTEEDGLRLMEHVGWDFTAALQAVRTLQAWSEELMGWELIEALVPPKAGFGYADSLVFGKGRRRALGLAEGVSGSEVLRALGLVRYYLLQYARLRADTVEAMSNVAVQEVTGISTWQWVQKYKPTYARYTNDRIRMRLQLVEGLQLHARAGAHGVLELLALEW